MSDTLEFSHLPHRRGKITSVKHAFFETAPAISQKVCDRVVHGVTMPDWFVTFEIRKRGLLHKRERSPRESRMFATEAEAKMFARAKLDEGLIVFAGTVS